MGNLGTCNMGEHSIDTQGFPPSRIMLGRLSLGKSGGEPSNTSVCLIGKDAQEHVYICM